MSVIEIVGGAILLVVSAVIILLTLMQHTHGQESGRCHQRWCGRCQQCTPDPCGSDAGQGDPHCRHRVLCGGYPGLCVRQPSGLSTRVQPRVRRGCFSV